MHQTHEQGGVVGGVAHEDATEELRAGLVEEELLVGVVEGVVPRHGDLVVLLLQKKRKKRKERVPQLTTCHVVR